MHYVSHKHQPIKNNRSHVLYIRGFQLYVEPCRPYLCVSLFTISTFKPLAEFIQISNKQFIHYLYESIEKQISDFGQVKYVFQCIVYGLINGLRSTCAVIYAIFRNIINVFKLLKSL